MPNSSWGKIWPRVSLPLLTLAVAVPAVSGGSPQTVIPNPGLRVEMIGGPSFTVEQANPTSSDSIMIPAGDREPLVVYARITNESAEEFIGIPSSTYFGIQPEDPVLLTGHTDLVDGVEVYEGLGLTDVPAAYPFIGGFILAPGESREFVLHVISGLLCPACEGLPGPALLPAPCGLVLSLMGSTFEVRTGEMIAGEIYSDPNAGEWIILDVEGSYPMIVTVTCGLSVADQIDALAAKVQELVDTAVLRSRAAGPLLTALERAKAALEAGRPFLARVNMRIFLALVRTYMRIGRLTIADGDPLVDTALEILAELTP